MSIVSNFSDEMNKKNTKKKNMPDVDDFTTLKTLYCSLVRPRVEYASRCGILIQRVT